MRICIRTLLCALLRVRCVYLCVCAPAGMRVRTRVCVYVSVCVQEHIQLILVLFRFSTHYVVFIRGRQASHIMLTAHIIDLTARQAFQLCQHAFTCHRFQCQIDISAIPEYLLTLQISLSDRHIQSYQKACSRHKFHYQTCTSVLPKSLLTLQISLSDRHFNHASMLAHITNFTVRQAFRLCQHACTCHRFHCQTGISIIPACLHMSQISLSDRHFNHASMLAQITNFTVKQARQSYQLMMRYKDFTARQAC